MIVSKKLLERKKRNKTGVWIFLFLVPLNIFSWTIAYGVSKPQEAEVIFFDVGQGDSALIKTPEGHLVLIDGGPGKTILEKLPKYIPFWEKSIDLIILTHPHQDHLEGLIYVLENYNIENILWTGALEETVLFEKWQKLIENGDSNVKIAKAGQRIRAEDFILDILYPFDSLENIRLKDANLSSIVLRIESGGMSYIFTGDTYNTVEKELTQKSQDCRLDEEESGLCRIMVLKSDVLKVAHHGSKTSTSEEFLENVYPLVAVISSGEGNRYGHPHREVLEVLARYGIRILRTDEEGDIKILPIKYD